MKRRLIEHICIDFSLGSMAGRNLAHSRVACRSNFSRSCCGRSRSSKLSASDLFYQLNVFPSRVPPGFSMSFIAEVAYASNAEAVMTARYTCSNAAACCPPLPRLRRDSRRTDVPGMRIRVVRLHQPLDSRA